MEVYMQMFLGKRSQNSQSRIRAFIKRGKSPQFSCYSCRSPSSSTLRKLKLVPACRVLSPKRLLPALHSFSLWHIPLLPMTPKWQPHWLRAQVGLHQLSAHKPAFSIYCSGGSKKLSLRPTLATLSCLLLLFVSYSQVPIYILVNALI